MNGFRTLHGDLETTIAQRMGNDWYEVGRRLEVADWELENIQADYPTQYRRACRVLQKWKHHRGEDATPEHLHSTLLDCRRTDLADLLLLPKRPEFRLRRNAVSSGRNGTNVRLNLTSSSSHFDRTSRKERQQFPESDERRRSKDDSCLDQARREAQQYDTVIYPEQHTASNPRALYANSWPRPARKQESNDYAVLIYRKQQCRSPSRNAAFDKSFSRKQGTMKLREKPDGTFLIRERDPSPQEPDHKHTLMVVINGEISNIKIFRDKDGKVYANNFTKYRKKFVDLTEMVTWHRANTTINISQERGIKEFYLTEQIVA